jgi:hypothetical protein
MKRLGIIAAAGALAGLALALSPAKAQLTATYANPNFLNLLDNGNFNTYQRGTTAVTGISNTATYHADRWAAFGGASSSITLTNVTAGVPLPFTNAERLQRAAANSNTAAIQLVEEISSADSIPMAGQQVVLSFWAKADGNFSAASGNMTASVVSGTGTDEGLATLISGWTGAATPVTGSVAITSTWTRYAVTGTIGTTATELAVELGFTPVGTAGTTDGIEVTGVQLERGNNPSAFEWRPFSSEFPKLVRNGFYRFSEPASGAGVAGACQATGATANICNVFLPVPMRAATPTITITTAGTFKVNIAGTPTTIASPTAGTCSSSSCTVTAGNTNTSGQAETLTGGGGTGKWDVSGDF